jgi:hypothetical protein
MTAGEQADAIVAWAQEDPTGRAREGLVRLEELDAPFGTPDSIAIADAAETLELWATATAAK